MRYRSLISTYELLNSEDRELLDKLKPKSRVSNSLLLAVGIMILLLAEDVLGSVDAPFYPRLIFIFLSLLIIIIRYFLSSVSYTQMWFLFCNAKSIEVENRNTQGYKNALEKYIASKEDYYSIDRIVDRVNLLVDGLDRFSELNDTLKSSILENIDDKEFLKQIVIHPNSPNKLRKLSIANIHDDKFLFEQAIKHFPTYGIDKGDYGPRVLSTSIQRAAVNQIKSEIILKNLVLEPMMASAVNDAAIKKITDQDFHKTLVLKSKSIAKAKAAIWQIIDKDFLEDLIDDKSKHTYKNALLDSIIERLRVLKQE